MMIKTQVADNVPQMSINPSQTEEGDNKINSMVLTTFCPIQTKGVKIPDYSTVATRTKKTFYNTAVEIPNNLSGGVPELLFVVLPHNKRRAVLLYVKWEEEGIINYTFWKTIDPDQDIAKVYSRSRFVSSAFSVVANTVTGTDLTIKGDINAVQFQDFPDLSQITHSTLTSFKRNDRDVISSTKISKGVITLAHPDDDTKLKPTLSPNVYNIDSVVIQSFSFDAADGIDQTGALDLPGYGALRITVNEISTGPGIGNLIQSNAANNFISIGVTLEGDRFDDGTNSVFNQTLDTVCAATSANTVANGETIFLCPNATYVFNNGLGPGKNPDFYQPVERIRLQVVGSTGGATWVAGSIQVQVEYLENYWTGFQRPGTLISIKGIAPETQLICGGATNWEVVPDKDLQRELTITTSAKGDPKDLLQLKYLMAAGFPDNRIRFLYTLSDYNDLWKEGVFQRLASRSNLDRYAMSLPGILKFGWNAARPLMKMGLPALASMIAPSMLPQASQLGDMLSKVKFAKGTYRQETSSPSSTYSGSRMSGGTFYDEAFADDRYAGGSYPYSKQQSSSNKRRARFAAGSFKKSVKDLSQVKTTQKIRKVETLKRPTIQRFQKHANGLQKGAQASGLILKDSTTSLSMKRTKTEITVEEPVTVNVTGEDGTKTPLTLPSGAEPYKIETEDFFVGVVQSVAPNLEKYMAPYNAWPKTLVAPSFLQGPHYNPEGRSKTVSIHFLQKFVRKFGNEILESHSKRASLYPRGHDLYPFAIEGFEDDLKSLKRLEEKGMLALCSHGGILRGPKLLRIPFLRFVHVPGSIRKKDTIIIKDTQRGLELALLLIRIMDQRPFNYHAPLPIRVETRESPTERFAAGSFKIGTDVAIQWEDPVSFADGVVPISSLGVDAVRDSKINIKTSNWLRGALSRQKWGLSHFPSTSEMGARRTPLIWSEFPLSSGIPVKYLKITIDLGEEEIFVYYINASAPGVLESTGAQEFVASIGFALYYAAVADGTFVTIPVKDSHYGISAGLAAFAAASGIPRGAMLSGGVNSDGELVPIAEESVDAKVELAKKAQIPIVVAAPAKFQERIIDDTASLFLGNWNQSAAPLITRRKRAGQGGSQVMQRIEEVAAPSFTPVWYVNKLGPAAVAAFAGAHSIRLKSEVLSADKGENRKLMQALSQKRQETLNPIRYIGEEKKVRIRLPEFTGRRGAVGPDIRTLPQKYDVQVNEILSMQPGGLRSRKLTDLAKLYYNIGASKTKNTIGKQISKIKKAYIRGDYKIMEEFGFQPDDYAYGILDEAVETNMRPNEGQIEHLMQFAQKALAFRNGEYQKEIARRVGELANREQSTQGLRTTRLKSVNLPVPQQSVAQPQQRPQRQSAIDVDEESQTETNIDSVSEAELMSALGD